MASSPEDTRIVKDGFGSEWRKCQFEDCDLHVVRPGKVQCSNCDVCELRAERAQLRSVLEQLAAYLADDPAAGLHVPARSAALLQLRALQEFGLIDSRRAGGEQPT